MQNWTYLNFKNKEEFQLPKGLLECRGISCRLEAKLCTQMLIGADISTVSKFSVMGPEVAFRLIGEKKAALSFINNLQMAADKITYG